jgi:ATP-dependent Lhr-like helicase
VAGWLRGNSQRVLDILGTRGASFFQELKALSQLLPAHLDDALRELAAWGLVTCDGFAAVRAFVRERKSGRGQVAPGITAPAGRWSKFPGDLAARPDGETCIERWCGLLLRRYGVLFRDLLAREASAPSWQELVPTLRRLELKGEIRGGRFVAGVAGEQFASESAVEQLRGLREEPAEDSWVLISAADPLNLSGILDTGPRIPANHKNTLILRGGRFVAARQAGQITFFAEFPSELAAEMRRTLQTGRRDVASHVRPEWLDARPIASRPRSLLDAPSRTVRRP